MNETMKIVNQASLEANVVTHTAGKHDLTYY